MHMQTLIDLIRRFTTISLVYKGAEYLWHLNVGKIEIDDISHALLIHYARNIIVLGLLETSDIIFLTDQHKVVCSLEKERL